MSWEPGKRYRITHASESGETTERTIDVIGTSRAYGGRLYIRAYRLLRGEERTFRADRVIHSELLDSQPGSYTAARTAAEKPSASQSHGYHAEPVPVQPSIASMQAAAYAGLCTTPEHSSPAPGTRRGRGAAVLVLVLGIGAGLFAYYQETAGCTRVSSGTAFSSTPQVAVKPAIKPAPPPKPALEEGSFGGYLLRTVRSGGKERFEVPDPGVVTAVKAEAISAIRLPRFVEAMGFFNPDLACRYLDADLNGSGRLSFDELRAFQERTYRDFRYETNELALRPDEFLAAGGGDCEDFALYTPEKAWGLEM